MTWHQIAFHIGNKGVDTRQNHIDTLIACEVLADHLETIPSQAHWRFHRRYDHYEFDNARHGQIFRWSVDCRKSIAYDIFEFIKNNETLLELKSNRIVRTVTTQTIEDITDDRWYDEVRKAWPHFMQGMSQFWLNLALNKRKEVLETFQWNDISSMIVGYRHVEARLDEQWERQLCHPLFHHINALFGGKPINAKVEVLMKF